MYVLLLLLCSSLNIFVSNHAQCVHIVLHAQAPPTFGGGGRGGAARRSLEETENHARRGMLRIIMSSKNHLFLVTKEIQQCRSRTSLGEQRKKITPGSIVVVRPFNDVNQFELHRGVGASFSLFVPVLMTREGGLPRDRVAAINDQEFDILMAAC